MFPPNTSTVRFSPESDFLTVSRPNGFRVYSVSPLRLLSSISVPSASVLDIASIPRSDISVCATAPHSGGGALCVFDRDLGRAVMRIERTAPVLRAFASADMFGFATPDSVCVYTFSPPVVHALYRTAPTARAPCDFVQRDGHYLLALVGRTAGMLRLIRSDRSDYSDVSLTAHAHPLSHVRFSSGGALVATASEAGTLVQVYDARRAELIARFRRGNLPTEITSLCFSPDSEYVATASAKGTVHLFALAGASPGAAPRAAMKVSLAGAGGIALSFAGRELLYAATGGALRALRVCAAANAIAVESEERIDD